MLRIHLTDAQRSELQALRRSDLPAVARDRLEMVFLSDAGWSPPRIADHLGRHPHTVRAALKGFGDRGTKAFYPDAPGPDPDHARRATVTGTLAELLGQDRAWTSRQLADALGPDIGIGHRQTLRYLALLKAGYRRTAQTVGHKQNPEKVRRARQVLDAVKKKAAAGRLRLHFLDECGFSPSLPTGYSWCLPRQRKRVKYEYPQGRRVNALATYEPLAPTPRLDAVPFERTLTSDDLLAYLRDRLPVADVPRVVVLDNAGIHTSKVVKAARPGLAKLGIYLYYLPPYSPELNRIEPVFKQVKHHDMPTRSFTTRADLRAAVEAGFETYRSRLRPKDDNHPRLAA